VKREVSAFNDLCSNLVDKERYLGKELALWMITGAEERRIVGSLAMLRQERNGEKFTKGGAILSSLDDLQTESQKLGATANAQAETGAILTAP